MSASEPPLPAHPRWTPAPPRPAAADDELHLWRLRLDLAAGELAELAPLLDAEESARAARFRFAADRRAFVAAHGQLRRVLAAYLDADPAALDFRADEHGKPALDRPPGRLGFNLSHSGERALVAVSGGRAVGVDIERHRRPSPEGDVARRLFTARELPLWRGLAAAERTRLFFLSWAAKEALVKAIGRGLGYPLHDLEVLAPDGGGLAPRARVTGGGRIWRLTTFVPADGYAGAVASAEEEPALRLHRFWTLPGEGRGTGYTRRRGGPG